MCNQKEKNITKLESCENKLIAYDLRCEYLNNPIGIDVKNPRFSWKLKQINSIVRGERQTAYRIFISSSLEKINKNDVDVYDSGKLLSSQSVNIECEGINLNSEDECFWKVKIWDMYGNESDWSTYGRFTIGLLNKSYWNGSWITNKDLQDTNLQKKHVWFRKKFILHNEVSKAFAYVCSLGYHELYINSVKVDKRVLSPGRSRIQDGKRALYITYDIKDYLVKAENVIAIWTAAGWTRTEPVQSSGFICQVNIITSDETTKVFSDSDWKCKNSSSKYLGKWEWGDFGGESFDARQHISDWNKIDYDDNDWENAIRIDKEINISAEIVEPDCVIEVIDPVSITGDEIYKIDMGKNYTGLIDIKLHSGCGGQKVTFKIADKETEEMTFNQVYEYIYDNSGNGRFLNRFNYFAGRYITVEGLNYTPLISDVKGYAVSNERKRIGAFSCSDNLLNTIYETDLWTYIVNTINGVTVDCPHRERLGYGETGFNTTWGCGLTNYESGAFYTSYIRNWCDSQSEDGYMPHVAPNCDGGGGTAWSCFVVFGVWEFYKVYKDERLLLNSYGAINKWLEFLNSKVEDGILKKYENDEWGFLGDWATPHGGEWGDSKDALLFNNCVYACALEIGVNITNILGLKEDKEKFKIRLDLLRKNIQNFFFDKNNNSYLENKQLNLIMPLYTKVVPENLISIVLDTLIKDFNEKKYIDSGSSGITFLLKYLIEVAGRPDLIYNCLMETKYPGYGYFIKNNQTTWPEMWDISNIYGGSRIHTCYTGIAGFFTKGIAGIQPDKENYGFKTFVVKPYFTNELEWVKSSYESMYGEIICNWWKNNSDNSLDLCIQVPVNTTAKVYIPIKDVNRIAENNTALENLNTVGLKFENEKYYQIILESGKYNFKIS